MSVANGESNAKMSVKLAKSYCLSSNSANLNEEIMPFSVFLGGSCNPTTWRTDCAIPLLQRLNISYFNPQVTDGKWGPKLIDLENKAKQIAEVLLFVIDNKTRSVASMIEAAHCIGVRANDVVLCIQHFDSNDSNCLADGEKLSPTAIEDYNRGRMYLMDLARRAGVPVFDNIQDAVRCAATKCSKNNSKFREKI